VVVVQGDTTSAAAGTLVAFLNRIPLLHVEAGLRTSSIADPFPEEAYRRIITICATFHCAPTIAASERLMSEGVPPHQIRVTGNTVIDSLANSLKRTVNPLPDRLDADSPFILLTAHRRDHSDRRATHIARAVKDILSRHRSLHVIAPLHPNGVAQQLGSELASENRVFLTAPLPYEQFIWCLQHCRAVVTDSGGVQEEAVALGVPTIVVRDSTERGEGIGHGINVVGLDPENIARAVDYTLRSTSTSRREALVDMTFGDGCASPRIVEEIAHLHQITRFNVAGEECRVF